MDLLLRAQDGVSPRVHAGLLPAGGGKPDGRLVHHRRRPISDNPFKLVSVSDEWDTVLNGGALIECRVSLNIEEYT